MDNIKLFDCTLREGGYVNDWDFKEANIKSIINNLSLAGCDYIECGFLKKDKYSIDKTLFTEFKQLENLLPKYHNKTQFCLMINYGEIPIESIPTCNTNINLRVVFKKENLNEALEYSEMLVDKGYKVFINPMNSNTYSEKEYIDLIKQVNKINPIGFTIVDTTGSMNQREVLYLFYLIEENLNKNIALCFHSHNNLQLSLANTQVLLEQNTERTLIIDSTVMGIGRGAGNLCTEIIMPYLNDNYNKCYNLSFIFKVIYEQINKIYEKTPWGYSIPYYLAAKLSCHPSYAKFLIGKQIESSEFITKVLSGIPDKNKGTYNNNLIEKLYNEAINL